MVVPMNAISVYPGDFDVTGRVIKMISLDAAIIVTAIAIHYGCSCPTFPFNNNRMRDLIITPIICTIYTAIVILLGIGITAREDDTGKKNRGWYSYQCFLCFKLI